MIEVSNVVKSYKKEVVLDIEQLHIGRGEVLGLVGNNGAGKTTLFSLLLDLIKANQGHITNKEIRVDQSEECHRFFCRSVRALSHAIVVLMASFFVPGAIAEAPFTTLKRP